MPPTLKMYPDSLAPKVLGQLVLLQNSLEPAHGVQGLRLPCGADLYDLAIHAVEKQSINRFRAELAARSFRIAGGT